GPDGGFPRLPPRRAGRAGGGRRRPGVAGPWPPPPGVRLPGPGSRPRRLAALRLGPLSAGRIRPRAGLSHAGLLLQAGGIASLALPAGRTHPDSRPAAARGLGRAARLLPRPAPLPRWGTAAGPSRLPRLPVAVLHPLRGGGAPTPDHLRPHRLAGARPVDPL